MTLRQALLGCSTGQLRRIADAWGQATEAGLLRRELVDLLVEHIGGAVGSTDLWAALRADESAVMQRLVRARGHHESALLVRRAAARPTSEDGTVAERVGEAVERLVTRGLAFRVFEADGPIRRTALVLPEEILQAAEARLAPSSDVRTLLSADEPSSAARCDPLHDLFVLASALRREAHAAASRAMTGRQPRTVAQVLAGLGNGDASGPDEPGRRWRFLLWVGKRAGWFVDRGWPTPDDERLERLLGDRRTLIHEALAAAGPAAQTPDREPRQPDLVTLHADALQVLAEIEARSWVPADALVRHLWDELGALSAVEPDQSDRVERRTNDALHRWLTARWFWLGIVDWGRTEHDWSLVSPHPDLIAPVAPRTSDRSEAFEPCAVVSDFQLTAPLDSDLRTLYRCEPYLAYRGTEADIRRYDLTPASVARGLRLGGDVHDLRGMLVSLLQAPLPPSWDAAIERWVHPGNALRLEPRVLLVGREASDLSAALDAGTTRRAISERLSDRHAVVALDQVADLLARLAEAGMPVEVDPALRLGTGRPGQAASLGDGVAEAAWVALDTLRRLAPDAFSAQRDLTAALSSLEAVLPAATLEVLERRARTVAALAADRRGASGRPGRRKRLP
jgi:hypothetical protein